MTGPIQRRRVILALSGSFAVGGAGCLGRGDGESEQHGGDNHSNGSDEHSHGNESQKQDGGQSTSHAHDQTHELGNPQSEITIEMATDDGHHYLPHVVHIETGGTVTWEVKSGSHDATAYHPETHGDQQRIPDGAEPWASDRLSEKGQTFERQFDTEGVYDYACTPHERTGMVGSIIVGWPDPAEQPGLEPPADDLPDAAVDQLKRFNEQVRKVLEEGKDGENGGHDDHSNDTHSSGGHDH